MPERRRVLVIEDDPDGLRSVVEAIEDAGYAAVAAAYGAKGIEKFKEGGFDAVLSDVRLPDMDGVEVLKRIRAADDSVPVLLMTAFGTVESAVAALKAGAYDYVLKPLDLTDIQVKVRHAIENRTLRLEVNRLQAEARGRFSASAMVVASAAMKAVLEQVATVAATDATVLILGESGTGKELIARALHADGKRSRGPFVAVNCGAFSESLLESELFGHEKGSFTGATERHLGAFERAGGGTLFLDEIGIAPRPVQMRLLRAIEQREIIRVGGREPVPVDVRVVSATNRNLDDLVAEGEFLPDLRYRLQVVTIRVPPLRDRREDIRPLAIRFMAMACSEHGRHIRCADQSFFDALERHSWPGNVRELRNAVESAVIMATSPVLSAADLRLEPSAAAAPAQASVPAGMSLAAIERLALVQALQRHKGSRTLAAEELGISTRTIQRKIREYDLPF